jgi:transcriptional regulator with GAF, ATPase, and Fis domain
MAPLLEDDIHGIGLAACDVGTGDYFVPRMKMKDRQAKYFLRVNAEVTIASDSALFGEMIRRIEAVAKSDLNVLLIGRPGSGKELVAEAIHTCSPRKGLLVKVNCAALSSNLLESELFGHVKGSFTGAIRDRDGAFVAADGGTLFLDELCRMDVELQPKLLRAVEYGEFRPVGSDEEKHSSARMVAAVNEDVAQAIESKSLRLDLYYRLASYVIRVPDMEERPEDIPRIVSYFFNKLCRPAGIKEIEPDAMAKISAYRWPGNVRELRAAIEAGIVNCTHRKGTSLSTRDLDAFPSEIARASDRSASCDMIKATADAIYSGLMDFPKAEVEIRTRLLKEIRDREAGNTERIASVLQMNQSAVRSMFGRAGLALGHSYRRAACRGSVIPDSGRHE